MKQLLQIILILTMPILLFMGFSYLYKNQVMTKSRTSFTMVGQAIMTQVIWLHLHLMAPCLHVFLIPLITSC